MAALAFPHLTPQPTVLNTGLQERLNAANNAQRVLTNELGMTVNFTKLAGQRPQIAIQFVPRRMNRVLNRMTDRHQHDDGEFFIVSGRFMDVIVMWAVPK